MTARGYVHAKLGMRVRALRVVVIAASMFRLLKSFNLLFMLR